MCHYGTAGKCRKCGIGEGYIRHGGRARRTKRISASGTAMAGIVGRDRRTRRISANGTAMFKASMGR